jgi:hypothetical protein
MFSLSSPMAMTVSDFREQLADTHIGIWQRGSQVEPCMAIPRHQHRNSRNISKHTPGHSKCIPCHGIVQVPVVLSEPLGMTISMRYLCDVGLLYLGRFILISLRISDKLGDEVFLLRIKNCRRHFVSTLCLEALQRQM